MKFFDRQKEIAVLRKTAQLSQKRSVMTVVNGRRRIGKTRLLLQTFQDDVLYFFVTRKSEPLLCEEFTSMLKEALSVPVYGEIRRFADLFEMIMDISRQRKITLIIDEFQNFVYVNPSFFPDLQRIWDLKRDTSRINLILSGSSYTLMQKIFSHAKEPLFGRADMILTLKPFRPNTIKQILKTYNPDYTPKDLLLLYMITGGIPKYIEIFMDRGLTDFEAMANFIFSDLSPFINEGKYLLTEEFGKDYATYFSILSLIASSRTSRSEIENVLGKDVGGFIANLEKNFDLIRQVKPIVNYRRKVKYEIKDNFLNFWFRYFYKNWSVVEAGNLSYLKQKFLADFDVYAGKVLEKYFTEKLTASKRYSRIGRYWSRKGENEIDIVAINDEEKKVDFYEVKLNPGKIKLNVLKHKSLDVLRNFPDYEVAYYGLSIEDM